MYAILMETSGSETESWMNFIKFEGNENSLEHLQKQLNRVDMVIIEDLSTFDLDLDHLVSEQTATEMCKVDLNSYMLHRKFDGILKKINFNFEKGEDNEDRIEKVHEVLGYGDIDNFIDGEDFFGEEPCKDDDHEDDHEDEDEDEDEDHEHEEHEDEDDKVKKLREKIKALKNSRTRK